MTLNGLHIQISACKSGVNREPKATKVPAKHSSGGGAFNAIPRQTTHSDDCRQAEKLLMYAFNAIPRQSGGSEPREASVRQKALRFN